MNEILDHVDINPRKLGHGRGSARTDALIGPAACGRCPKTDSLKRRASARALSLVTLFLFKRNSLSNVAGTPRTARWTRALRSAEANYTRIKDCVNAATCRTSHQTASDHSFPRDVTQQFQVSTREQPKQHEPTTWKTKPNSQPAYNQQTASITNKAFYILTKLVNIRSECRKESPRHLS